jgi:peptidyl-prolyl cis-trans isomerase D
MLQFLRSKAGSFFFRILFVVLIGSFGIFGIGDFLRQRPEDNTVIQVGDRKITAEQLRQVVQRVVDRSNGALTLAQAKALGIVDQAVQAQIRDAILEQEAARQHLVISDQQILAAANQEEAFKGPSGRFDRTIFLDVLAHNNLTEAGYEGMLRTNLPRSLLARPVLEGAAAPAALADLLYRARNEQRIADWVYLPAASATDIPAPDDKALHDYYDQHHDVFTAPEFRAFTLLPLQHQDVAGDVTISDDKLQAAYQERLDSLTRKEKRHVLQMLLHSEADADAASKALESGKDFTAVAKDVAKQDPGTIDLGTIEKTDLPAAVADAAFAAADGSVTKPVKGPFGWSILKIAGIEPGGVKSFADAKDEITKDLRDKEEGDALYELSNKVQDALSGGAGPAAIAEQFKLKTIAIAAADRDGKGEDGKPVPGITLPVAQVMSSVFETPEGQVSALQEVGHGDGYFLVKIDHVTPSALKPFDSVKDQVRQALLDDARRDRIAAQGKLLVDQVTAISPLADVAAERKLKVATTPPFTRTNARGEAPLPPALISEIFQLKQGQAATAPAPQGQYVAQLKEIKPADPAADKPGFDKLTTDLTHGIAEDLLEEFQGALKKRYPVTINQAAIDQAFAATPE